MPESASKSDRARGLCVGEDKPAVALEDVIRDRPSRPRVLDSGALFAGAREIVIRHETNHYRLRMTALGKLILTK